MKKKHIFVFFVIACSCVANAATDSVRGGRCYSPNAMLAEAQTYFHCDFIGKVTGIKEIYEKGFRVISSGFVPKDAGGGISSGFYVLIEERK